MSQLSYTTPHGITVTRKTAKIPFARGLQKLLTQLDTKRGVYFSSGYEYPERYSRWDFASVAPSIELVCQGRRFEIRALNRRGCVIIQLLARVLRSHSHWDSFEESESALLGQLKPLPAVFPEEERSKQPSPFSILRALVSEFQNPADSRLGLIGAFGYDLLLQFDPIRLRLPRENQKDIHLFLCDDIYFMDRKKEVIERYSYDFSANDLSTAGLPRDTPRIRKSKVKSGPVEIRSDHRDHAHRRKKSRSNRKVAGAPAQHFVDLPRGRLDRVVSQKSDHHDTHLFTLAPRNFDGPKDTCLPADASRRSSAAELPRDR